MRLSIKTIQAFLLTFAIAMLFGTTSSYAFTVKDGDNVIESPDHKRWVEKVGFYPDGRTVSVNLFDGAKAENGLSVVLSSEDLKQTSEPFSLAGDIKIYIFIDGTAIYAELGKDDDAILLKDYSCILTNTGTEIDDSTIKGGSYVPSEDLNGYTFYGDNANTDELAVIAMFFLNRYDNLYKEMLVTYGSVNEEPGESGEEPIVNEPETPAEPTEPTEPEAPVSPVQPVEQPAEPPVAHVSEPVPEQQPEAAQEEPSEEQPVHQEMKTVAPAEKETVKEIGEAIEQAKATETTNTQKRTETSILGVELKYQITAVVPAGVDERSVSSLQKQVSDVVDGLLKEIADDPSAAKERVSGQTLSNIQRALSEGKEISAEIRVEMATLDTVPTSDLDAFVLVTAENEAANLKIGKYFNIGIMIMADDGEELGNYNEITDAITFTLPKPKDVPCPEGMEYVVIRIHDGEAAIIPVTVNEDGSLSFETDRFSSYALAVREVMDEEVAKSAGANSEKGSEEDEDLKDFVAWFLRILVLAFASGTLVILWGLHEKKKSK